MALGLPVALAAFCLFNPPLWHQPLAGFAAFWDLNVHRAAHAELNVATCFFGRLYDARHPLPWYNTVFWTGVTVPVGILALAGIGVGCTLRRGFKTSKAWVGQKCPTYIVGQECPTYIVGQKCPTYIVGQECPTYIVGQKCPTYIVGQKCPTYIVGQECPTYKGRRMGILARRVARGLKQILKHRPMDGTGLLLCGQWLVLLVVRALPIPPPHDAERLILPSFAFLAALAGIGAAVVCRVGQARVSDAGPPILKAPFRQSQRRAGMPNLRSQGWAGIPNLCVLVGHASLDPPYKLTVCRRLSSERNLKSKIQNPKSPSPPCA